MAWYVVYSGREPRVYATWATCHAQVTSFKNFYYKSFPSKEEAVVESYMEFKGCEDDKVFVKPAATVVCQTILAISYLHGSVFSVVGARLLYC